jgi:hypothetical protein
VKQGVLHMLESATRGLLTVWMPSPNASIPTPLAKLQAPPLTQIADMKTLEHVVFGLEELASPYQHSAA